MDDTQNGAWVDGPDAGVRLRLAGPIATVTLDRPQVRNAQTPATWRALAEVGRRLPEQTRIVVLRAEGPSFSAGLDRRMFTPDGIPGESSLAMLATLSAEQIDTTIATYQQAFTWWARSDIVSIAAVQGHAVGAGFQLALACDVRIAADDAAFAMRETSLGLVPDLAGTWPLVHLVGYPRALEICVTGRWVNAAEAARLGLVELVVGREGLDATVGDLCAALTASPAAAVRATKELLLGAVERSPEQQRTAERAAQAERLRALAVTRDGPARTQ